MATYMVHSGSEMSDDHSLTKAAKLSLGEVFEEEEVVKHDAELCRSQSFAPHEWHVHLRIVCQEFDFEAPRRQPSEPLSCHT